MISKSVHLAAPVKVVWKALTLPERMKSWMFDDDLEVLTTWELGSPIVIRVPALSYKSAFTNTGTVLEFEQERVLAYNYLSSLSGLPDAPENYTLIRFTLQNEGEHTLLELELSNFPTASHYHHINFYWTITLEVLKRYLEN